MGNYGTAESCSGYDQSLSRLNSLPHGFGGTEGPKAYLKTFELYAPLWGLLTKDPSLKVRKANYERVFNEAARRVRAWEAGHSAAQVARSVRWVAVWFKPRTKEPKATLKNIVSLQGNSRSLKCSQVPFQPWSYADWETDNTGSGGSHWRVTPAAG